VMKRVNTIIPAAGSPHWVGDGFHVLPVFNNLAFSTDISPFLMFDFAAPEKFPPTKKKRGVGMHPHRGFETITIALQGEVEHSDSEGNTGIIRKGDVQWMTAGSGIFHDEFHSRAFSKTGGMFEMCQLWLNLPARLKMVKPRYQGIMDKDIPRVPLTKGAGSVSVIAGEFQGVKGAANVDFVDENTGEVAGRGHVDLWQISVSKGQTVDLPTPEGHTTILFVRSGELVLGGEGGTALEEMRVALMDRQGTFVKLHATTDTVAFLMGGEPILDDKGEVEPIVSHGPMVMNTRAEIVEAMQWARSEMHR